MHEGGCLCGAVRYRIPDIFDVVYCHCSRCRKRSGAPVSVSVVVAKDGFQSAGELKEFRRGSGVGRFCPICGSQISFSADDSPFLSVSLGTLDHPELVEPKIHQWTEAQLPWLKIDDALMCVADGTLPHPDARRAHSNR